MSATIIQTKAAIATIIAAITGVKRVYQNAPVSLPPSDLPAFIIYGNAATYIDRGAVVNVLEPGEARRYSLRLHVAPMVSGVAGEEEAACDVFFARVRAAFPPGARLGRLSGILEAVLIGDSGVSLLPLGGSSYLGIEFTLEVTQ